SRVLEYMAQAQERLPAGAQASLGPDATGAGWVYEYALVDRTGHHDIMTLRSLQDWWLRLRLQSVEGVAGVACIGGMVKQYQVIVDPNKMRAYGVDLRQIREAIEGSNRESGGSVIELAEAEYMVRANGYVRSLDDLRSAVLLASINGAVITL